MTRHLIVPALLIASLGLFGCQAAAPNAVQLEANKAAVVRWLDEGDNKNNLAVADAVFAPEVVVHHPTSPEPMRGIEAIKASSAGLRAAFPDYVGHIHDVIGEGDRVVVRWSLRGTFTGSFMGLAPTGKPFDVPGITIYRFAGGKVAEAWYGMNMLEFFQQVGVTPPAAVK